MLGRYELIRPLARGGMAEVFLARRRGPGGVEKRLAIKRVRSEWVNDARFVSMFVQEARLSMSFAHKNIVPVFDFGRAGDELFLVMEYIDGLDFGAALKLGKVGDVLVDPLLVAYVGFEACQALDYAHRSSIAGVDQGVVHRDVTPRNVLLSFEGEVKLLDFGVATSDTDLTGKVRGTPSYMAPEQARGEPVDVRADLFSLGLVLWEAAMGRRAYAGEGMQEQLALAREGVVPPLDDTVPEGLRSVIERATSAEPGERFSNARGMQLALDEYLVVARAASASRTPPDHLLSSWLRAIDQDDEGVNGSAATELPEGPVLTFLEDGLEAIEQTLGASMRSIAETIADDDFIDGAAETPIASMEAEAPAAPARWPYWIAAALAIALGGAGVFSLLGGEANGEKVAIANDAAPPAASDAAALVEVRADDASPDGSPTPLAVPADAAPQRRAPRRDGAPHRRIMRDASVRSAGSGTVRVSSSPWAAVTVPGQSASCAETPCSIVLPAGKHTLVLSNPVARLSKRVEVVVRAGETTTINATLTQ